MKSCQNSSRLLASTFLKKKTCDGWILGILSEQWTVVRFAWNHTVSWQIINYYILECQMLNLWLNAFSKSLPDFAAKNAIFRLSKSANFIKNFATNPEFRQFSQKSIQQLFKIPNILSSRRSVFAISPVFRQKKILWSLCIMSMTSRVLV